MADRVRPLKFESATRGTQTDEFPTSLDANEDHLDARGLFVQSDASDDELAGVSRDGSGNMTFKDVPNATPKTLTELIAGTGALTEEAHKSLRQLVHFIDSGPGVGWTSGAFRENAGGLFPTSVIWWESASKLKKIVEKTIAGSVTTPSPITWKMYDTDGSTVLVTLVDTISYTGIVEDDRTRTWS